MNTGSLAASSTSAQKKMISSSSSSRRVVFYMTEIEEEMLLGIERLAAGGVQCDASRGSFLCCIVLVSRTTHVRLPEEDNGHEASLLAGAKDLSCSIASTVQWGLLRKEKLPSWMPFEFGAK